MNARQIIEAESPKRFLRNFAPRNRTVHHDWARWKIDRHGKVLDYQRAVEFPDYAQVDREDREMMAKFASVWAFDLPELEAYLGSSAPEGIEIADIGYWTRDGKYHPADAAYRAAVKHANGAP